MKKYKFTLIELMVVVAIMGILASLLLPVLGKARKKTIAINCVNNLKQVLIATAMYNEANDDYFPSRDPSKKITYDDLLAGYDGRASLSQDLKEENGLTSENVGGSTGIYKCPTSPSHQFPERSYGINLWGTPSQENYAGISGMENVGGTWIPKSRISSHINGPSEVIAYAPRYKIDEEDESFRMGKIGRDVTSAFQTYDESDDREYHQNKSNFGMVDGHVEKRNRLSTLIRLDGSGVAGMPKGSDVTDTIWDADRD